MSRSTFIAIVVFVLGSLAGFAGVAAVTGNEALPDVDGGTTTTTEPSPVWISDGEVVLGPAVLVPGELTIEGAEAVFSYSLSTLSPLADLPRARVITFGPGGGDVEIDPLDIDPVYPLRWVLVTSAGEIPGVTANPRSRTARFEIPDGFDPSSIESLRLESYQIPVPVEQPFELSAEEPLAGIAPGVSASLIQTVEQSGQTIVQIELVADEPSNRENLHIEGVGPEWLSAVREAEGRPRFNLRLAAAPAPDTLLMRARGFVWETVERPVSFPIEATA